MSVTRLKAWPKSNPGHKPEEPKTAKASKTPAKDHPKGKA